MNSNSWNKLIYRDNLTESDLRLIPATANGNVYVIYQYCVKVLKIDEEKLLEGLSIGREDFFVPNNWLNALDFKRFGLNIFNNYNGFIDFRMFDRIALDFLKLKKGPRLIFISLLTINFIKKNAAKIIRLFNNTIIPEIITVGKNRNYAILKYFPYTKNITLGSECRFVEGTLSAFLKFINAEIVYSKHLICEKQISRIVKYIYGRYNWEYRDDGECVYLNSKKIGRHVRLKSVRINNKEIYTDQIDEGSTNFNAVQIVDDFYYKGNTVFKKGEIFNAPYCCIEFRLRDTTYFKRYFTMISNQLKYRKPVIRKLEDQINFANNQIFELHRVSEELRRERNSLDNKVKERTLELKEANDKLLELDRIKTEFYTNVTHELRTPLTLIKSQVEAVKNELFGKKIECSSEIFGSIKRNADSLHRLINNLLNFSKIESREMGLVFEEIDLVQFITGIISNIGSAVRYNKLSCKFTCKKENLIADIDAYLFENALYNLLSNAIKFTPPGGRVSVILEETEKEILISVRDTPIIRKDVASKRR